MAKGATSLILAFAIVAFATPAFAYVDPNAGGLLFQVLTPVLAAVAACFAFARRSLGAAFQRTRDWLSRRFNVRR